MSVRPAGLGVPVRRVEDARLLTGRGRYTDDIALPGMAFAFMLRSPHAHARLLSVDARRALEAPGVLAVYTGEDVARAGLGDLPAHHASPPTGKTLFQPPYPLISRDRVRCVGDRVAMVVARTATQARDAAELIDAGYEPLPAAASIEAALASGAPKVWDKAESNLCFRFERGDERAVERAFASAAHRVRVVSRYPRISGNSMEPRSSIGHWDPNTGRYALYTGTQQLHRMKNILATAVLRIPETELRIVAMDIGGGFGIKGAPYAEDALVLWASKQLGCPVKWTVDRSEGLLTDLHGRDRLDEGEMALDATGRILGLRTTISVNTGAYLVYSSTSTSICAERFLTAYDIPHCHVVVQTVMTHTNSLGPYRGTGRPETTLFLERCMDEAARATGIDPVEIRRRNLVPPSAMPHMMPGGFPLDSGEFERILDRTVEISDWRGFEARREASRKAGRLRGRGLGMYCTLASSNIFNERMEIRLQADGTMALHAGTQSSGQGHETLYAQLASAWLGIPIADIRVFQGDTDRIAFGRGTFAGRSAMVGGGALRVAALEVVRKGKRFAAWLLEANEADIEFDAGRFYIAGTDRAVTLTDVAKRCYTAVNLPPELAQGLDGVGDYAGPPSFPNGCMVCEVEIDPETGELSFDRCFSVADCGVIVNPLTTDGQMHGSIGQAAGEMLVEVVRHDAEGQLLSGSFMDYAMPRADLFPRMVTEYIEVPSKTNLLGIKGGSEGGSCGTPAAIFNAVADAIGRDAAARLALPASPERLWASLAGHDKAAHGESDCSYPIGR